MFKIIYVSMQCGLNPGLYMQGKCSTTLLYFQPNSQRCLKVYLKRYHGKEGAAIYACIADTQYVEYPNTSDFSGR